MKKIMVVLLIMCGVSFCVNGSEVELGAEWESSIVGSDDVFAESVLSPWADFYLSDEWYSRIKLDIGAGTGYSSVMDNLIEDQDPWLLSIREAYVEYTNYGILARVGKFPIDFGQMYGPGSLSNLAFPLDLSDPIEWERMSVWGGLFAWDLEGVNFKIAPFLFQSSRNPYYGFSKGLPTGLMLNRYDPDYELQLAAQASWQMLDTDFAATGSIGRDPFSSFEFTSQVDLTEKHYQQKSVSFSASRSLFDGIVSRVSAGYTVQGDREYTQVTAGMSGEWQVGERGVLSGCVELSKEFEINKTNRSVIDALHFGHGNDSALMYGASYKPDENGSWGVKLSGSHNLEKGDGFIKTAIAYENTAGNINAEAGYRATYSGSKGGLWDNFRNAEGAYAQVSISFG